MIPICDFGKELSVSVASSNPAAASMVASSDTSVSMPVVQGALVPTAPGSAHREEVQSSGSAGGSSLQIGADFVDMFACLQARRQDRLRARHTGLKSEHPTVS